MTKLVYPPPACVCVCVCNTGWNSQLLNRNNCFWEIIHGNYCGLISRNQLNFLLKLPSPCFARVQRLFGCHRSQQSKFNISTDAVLGKSNNKGDDQEALESAQPFHSSPPGTQLSLFCIDMSDLRRWKTVNSNHDIPLCVCDDWKLTFCQNWWLLVSFRCSWNVGPPSFLQVTCGI